METEIERIVDQINRLHDGPCWTGSSIHEILGNVDENMANVKIDSLSKSIHQIVKHVLATENLVKKRFEGINYIITPKEDWPSCEELNDLSWNQTKTEIRESKKELIAKIQALKEAQLNTLILKDHSTIYVTLHGHVQHSLYHYGQISLIKRMIGAI